MQRFIQGVDKVKNYYKILGLEKECSKEEIKKAYRNLAKSTHPDALSGISDEQKVIMEERFSEINIAYKILSDENKRSIYDIRYENYINKKKNKKTKDKLIIVKTNSLKDIAILKK